MSVFLAGRGSGRHERGVAMIEFAVASGIMVMIVIGMIVYGEVLAKYVQLKTAVGEISRQVAASDQPSATFTAAELQAQKSFDTGCATFLYTPPASSGGVGEVRGTYNVSSASCRLVPSLFSTILPGIPPTLRSFNKFTAFGT